MLRKIMIFLVLILILYFIYPSIIFYLSSKEIHPDQLELPQGVNVTSGVVYKKDKGSEPGMYGGYYVFVKTTKSNDLYYVSWGGPAALNECEKKLLKDINDVYEIVDYNDIHRGERVIVIDTNICQGDVPLQRIISIH